MNENARQSLRRGLCGWTVIALVVLLCVMSRSAGQETAQEELLLDPHQMARVEASIDRALEYLLQQQRPDGTWPCAGGTNNAIDALCLLAFLGAGHVPGRGPYQDVVDRAINAILATQSDNGLYKPRAQLASGPMYSHALATLAMIEAYGFVPSAGMRTSVQKAVDLIVKSQSPAGGWRYQPVPADADLSVTVMQVVALRAAQNARLNVPEETMENALKYVRTCVVGSGGFSYQPGGGAGEARTAAGILSMQLLGAFDDPAVEKGLEWLGKRQYHTGIGYFWYMNYYAMQAHFQAGGKYWAEWQEKVRGLLLNNQEPDGSWPGYGEQKYNGPAFCYSTPIGALCLEVYMHYLPAYQR